MGNSSFSEQFAEIKALFSSEKTKALAYPKLLIFEEASAADSSSLQLLADSSHAILAHLVHDIFDNDEEIAAQALKCLGFMIYHPVIVDSIQGDDANAIIEALAKVIVATKIKSVCNLGIWCLSIQQFGSSLLDKHFQSLLKAIIHALDNPIGSLSTTFEAMQAVVKLKDSLPEHMKNTASVWFPPIYRRLVSNDKRDRDMSERCLLKLVPIIFPPSTALSKTLYVDLKKNLLIALKQLLDQGMKIQCLRAWGWFMRLLGSFAMKKKLLINEMLKVLEQTFSDCDSQVQNASLVAWEGLIDALIEPQVQTSHIHDATQDNHQVSRKSDGKEGQNESDSRLRRIKLIMAPLIGIMSSRCDISVHATCLSTWSYLLHRLEASIICQSVIESVWEPIIEMVFQVRPQSRNIWVWNFCLDLLNAFILGRDEGTICNLYGQERCHSSLKTTRNSHPTSETLPLRYCPMSFSPWSLCHVGFFIKMILILINHNSAASFTSECRKLANDGALKLFSSLLEAVQISFRRISVTYDEILQCLSTIFRFLTEISESIIFEGDNNHHCPSACLKFLETVTERLEPSFLESPLYKVELDPNFIKILECATEIKLTTMPGICFVNYEDKVLPTVYLSVLYFFVVIRSSAKRPEHETLLEQLRGYVKFLLSTHRSPEGFHTFIRLLYKNAKFDCFEIWVVLANSLTERINIKGEIPEIEREDIGCSLVFQLLSYPFVSCYFSRINLEEVQIVSEVWRLLHESVNRAFRSFDCRAKSFSENIFAMFLRCTETEHELKEMENDVLVQLYGSAIICVLGQSAKRIHNIDSDGRKSNIENCMELAARFMKLFSGNKERTEQSHLSVAPRFLLSLIEFVRCLNQTDDAKMLIETISSSLLEWLSDMHLLDESTNCQLQKLWNEILRSLQQSERPAQFDSSFLKFLEQLLAMTLDHPNPAISEPTIHFWNSTYGRQMKLEFPHKLRPILDKLFRNGKLKLFGRNHEDKFRSQERYNVTATLRKCSKRVEIVENSANGSDDFDKLCPSAKTRRSELTEHQKEVRRAQQGRSRDCSGHGPGIRTYTSVDFSQGNEESQDSQEIRNVESIWEMLRQENSVSFLR